MTSANYIYYCQSFTLNITTVQGFKTFIASLTNKSFCKEKEGTGVDLVLSCVDNYEARMVVNQVRVVLFLSCSAEHSLCFHIHS